MVGSSTAGYCTRASTDGSMRSSMPRSVGIESTAKRSPSAPISTPSEYAMASSP